MIHYLEKISSYGLLSIAIVVCILFNMNNLVAKAKEETVSIAGQVYEFDKDSHYELDEAEMISDTLPDNVIGQLTITGDISIDDDTSDGIPAYLVDDGIISLSYVVDPSTVNVDDANWCITEDKTKKVDGIELEANILCGALLLQTSLDGETWVTETIENSTDIFGDEIALEVPFYDTIDIQLQNGCYYRIYIAYEMRMRLDDKSVLFVDVENYDYKKVAEVYEFYASYAETGASAADTPRKTLGDKMNTGKDTGYSGNNEITSDDPHYGWDIGEFFINGYTRETKDEDGNTYFLKNVGDKVTLWFSLEQDISCLNGDTNLYIAEDTNGYDQYFETAKTDFGQGTLIIQYTDEEGVKHDPVIYTNYLAACARTGADTKVQLFEEGDYEVSLDYEIAKKSGPLSKITSYTDYRISFSFSIRNGNCMVYPFDVVTGSELTDQDITANGFSLDMAKSRYLTIDVTRTVLTMGTDGQLVEDVRFNRPAKDGDQYTDEGIYTFIVRNLYTGESTTKTIYVGEDPYLAALSINGYTLEELNAEIANGAVISEDGSITELIDIEQETEEEEKEDYTERETDTEGETGTETEIANTTEKLTEAVSDDPDAESETDAEKNSGFAYSVAIVLIFVLILLAVVMIRGHKNGQTSDNQ
ncbi:MAG: hypothetical protein LUI87_03680 [Lachnospiraceae bacterium]|nr:hypothetical protein [Lachnospiraceae bacterium]